MTTKQYPVFSILLVDDEPAWIRSLSINLERSGGISNILSCTDSRKLVEILSSNDVGLVLLDLTMPDISGEELLIEIKKAFPELSVIIISGMNQVKNAVECMKLGALDYIVKTQAKERLMSTVMNAIKLVELERENRMIKECFTPGNLKFPEAFNEIITKNNFMFSIFGYIEAIALTNQPVLITGESGTGKELVARTLHRLGRIDKKMVTVNVAGLDDNIFSDTLFGHTKGAFTGADKRRMGMIETAGDGTLFLDEIGDLSTASQVKLLRLIQEGEYYPVGSDTPKYSLARIVCSTHQNLLKKEKENSFRKDLYYRLHTHHIYLPPLRERKDDIPLLLDYFIEEVCKTSAKKIPPYPKELSILLSTYYFPGNIRQLKSMICDAVATHVSGTLSMNNFKKDISISLSEDFFHHNDSTGKSDHSNPFSNLNVLPTFSIAADLLTEEALKRTDGNQSMAAKLLGISQPALSKRLKGTAK